MQIVSHEIPWQPCHDTTNFVHVRVKFVSASCMSNYYHIKKMLSKDMCMCFKSSGHIYIENICCRKVVYVWDVVSSKFFWCYDSFACSFSWKIGNLWTPWCKTMWSHQKVFTCNETIYAKKKKKQEGNMAKGYMYDEALGFCMEYLSLYEHTHRRMSDPKEEATNVGEVF